VKLRVGGQRVVTTGEGNGPVTRSTRRFAAALRTAYPEIDQLRLTDYRVRVLDSADGTAAKVRVLLETS
jgi:2-isopropylmalate synthase